MSWLDPLVDGTLFWLAAQIVRDERERKYVAVAGGYAARRVRARRLAPLFPTDAVATLGERRRESMAHYFRKRMSAV